MSEESQSEDQPTGFDAIGEAFEMGDDPLKKFDDTFKEIEQRPTKIYIDEHLSNEDNEESYTSEKIRYIGRWTTHMSNYDRHLACPSPKHVMDYIDNELAKSISEAYIDNQLKVLSNMFEYFSKHPKMPHGTGEAEDYNPIETGRLFRVNRISKKTNSSNKAQYRMEVEEVGHQIRQIKNLLHRTVIATQFKYGSRSGQVSNLQIPELKLNNPEINELYPTLGTHRRVRDREGDVIYFVPRYERSGGKSQRPILMPIDSELRNLLVKYLRQRPPVNKPWLFINNASGNKLTTDYINSRMWKPAFRPEYAETKEFYPVTSHYGRHRFTTYWRKEIGLNIELIKYMRGDKQQELDTENKDAVDDYVHTYYFDVKNDYISKIYKFGI